jgi:hypothetical protein
MFEMTISVNRFLVSETINGDCTAYVYTNEDDIDAGGRPVSYSDNGDKPRTRISAREGLLDLRVTGGKPKGWRTAVFSSNGSIAGGSYIWFGVFAEYYWLPRFDYGAKCYRDDWWDYDMEDTAIPDAYPLYSASNYYNFKLSMYFTYSSAQNHVRILTQGVTLADSRKLAGAYNRTEKENVTGAAALSRFATFPRRCLMTAYNSMAVKGLPMLIRSVLEQVRAGTGIFERRGLSRKLPENVKADSAANRSQLFYRRAHEGVRGTDRLSLPALIFCCLREIALIRDKAGHCGAFCRKQAETVRAHGPVFRGLLIFVRLLATALVRNFLLRRFLKSNEEMVLKSGVCREIVINSKV